MLFAEIVIPPKDKSAAASSAASSIPLGMLNNNLPRYCFSRAQIRYFILLPCSLAMVHISVETRRSRVKISQTVLMIVSR